MYFAEILHAGGGAIDLKHIKQDFSLKAWDQSSGVDLGDGAKAKIKLFRNMVMLYINLKLTYGSNVFSTDTPSTLGVRSKNLFF